MKLLKFCLLELNFVIFSRDSDIVAPYEKWVYYNPKVTQVEQHKNYAANKTKKVRFFLCEVNMSNSKTSGSKMSNC